MDEPLYVALYTEEMVEVRGEGYSRQLVKGRQGVTFGPAKSDWGVITYIVVFRNGKAVDVKPLARTVTILEPDELTIDVFY
jgi:hypothetical protein